MSDKKRILLVEDYDDNRIVFTMLLEHHGYHVTAVPDGEAAVDVAAREPFDLVLMDISLPGINGWTAMSRMRERAAHRETPFVPVTAHALPEFREKAERLGCSGFLTKPCDPEEVLAHVSQVLDADP